MPSDLLPLPHEPSPGWITVQMFVFALLHFFELPAGPGLQTEPSEHIPLVVLSSVQIVPSAHTPSSLSWRLPDGKHRVNIGTLRVNIVNIGTLPIFLDKLECFE